MPWRTASPPLLARLLETGNGLDAIDGDSREGLNRMKGIVAVHVASRHGPNVPPLDALRLVTRGGRKAVEPVDPLSHHLDLPRRLFVLPRGLLLPERITQGDIDHLLPALRLPRRDLAACRAALPQNGKEENARDTAHRHPAHR